MSINQRVAGAMQILLTETADERAWQTGFVHRRRKLHGSGFAQALTLGWMGHPDHSWEQIDALAGTAGPPGTVQALHKRCGERSAVFLQALLAAATRQAIAATPTAEGLLARFPHVWVQDSASLALPAALKELWPAAGNGGQGGEAGLKLHLRLDLVSGRLVGPWPTTGRTSEKNCVLHQDAPPAGSLLLADMGYFDLSRMAPVDAGRGVLDQRLPAPNRLLRRPRQAAGPCGLARPAGKRSGRGLRADRSPPASGLSSDRLAKFAREDPPPPPSSAEGGQTPWPHPQRRGFGVVRLDGGGDEPSS